MFNRWYHCKFLAKTFIVLLLFLCGAFLSAQRYDLDDPDSVKIYEIPPTINPERASIEPTEPPDSPASRWREMQEKRRQRVREHCTKNSLKLEDVLSGAKESAFGFLDFTVVDESHQLIYCYAPRVASTNWRRIMLVMTGQVEANMNAIRQRDPRDMSQFKTLRKYTVEQRLQLVQNYTKFVFARHPYHRLDAVYYDRLRYDPKIVDNFQKVIGTDIIRRYRPAKYTQPKSLQLGHDVRFSELVQFLTDQTNADRLSNVHFAPVSDLCHPCLMNYTFIGRVEDLPEDASMILKEAANVTLPFRFPRPDKPSKTAERLAMDMRLLSDDQRAALYREYQQDFQLFDYDKDDWRNL